LVRVLGLSVVLQWLLALSKNLLALSKNLLALSKTWRVPKEADLRLQNRYSPPRL